ncbi:MAG: DNA double-strand break repair nuclease NurA [Anaerolineae bacterium]|nr:DNA double-strand break repair nuclease NurA [Anaerolineae bacterium]
MPVNYLQIFNQIGNVGNNLKQHELVLRERRQQAYDLLKSYDLSPNLINERVNQIASLNKNLRCAFPMQESLMRVFDSPSSAPPHIILAADGSQINPNFHDPVAYGVINSGAFRMASGLPSELPLEEVSSQLLLEGFQDENTPSFEENNVSLNEEFVALMRDLRERDFLVELSSREKFPVVALTDGPLELFRDPKAHPDLSSLFDKYLLALQKSSGLHTATAGYVDRPRSDLIIRMLELMTLSEDQFAQVLKNNRPLKFVTDTDLFRLILQPGQRSSLYGILSPSANKFTGQLALRFFYINVGLPGEPSLARVEIPEWVAGAPDLLDLLHYSLLEQCRLLGSRPFPYALHRAHEVAVVRFEEKDEITRMIVKELSSHGQPVHQSSNKQIHKEHSGIKKRFK